MGEPTPQPGPADPGLDAALDALTGEGAEALLAELLQGDAAPLDPHAASAKEIRARVKEVAAKNPALLAKIITYWMTEERRRK